MNKLRINNVFGIKPTTNHTAAGMDFYIPNIPAIKDLSDEKYHQIMEAFSKSFDYEIEELEFMMDRLTLQVAALYNEETAERNQLNLLHLYCALSSSELDCTIELDDKIEYFVDEYLIFDKNNKPGICAQINDHVKFNSGIKIKLDPNYAGVFFNKSGRGSKGWDVRACVVDEDYAGYVHCNLAMTSELYEAGQIYCGDKITQMLILEISHCDIEEVSDDEYTELQSESKRGADAFGSSNEKH